jgi:hypothetical protein
MVDLQKNKIIIVILLVAAVVIAGYMSQFVRREEEEVVDEASFSILFIGAGITDHNKGLDYHIKMLASYASPPLVIKADKIGLGEEYEWIAPLEDVCDWTQAESTVRTRAYDVVVLQESLHWTFKETFYEYVRMFDSEIKEKGGKTVLFAAYSVDSEEAKYTAQTGGFSGEKCIGYISTEDTYKAHCEIAEELDLEVIPFGFAWDRVMVERPDLNLYESDGRHPNIHGTYLAVNVVYATLFDESPEGLTYRPKGISEDEAAFLQRIAWETVQEYQSE